MRAIIKIRHVSGCLVITLSKSILAASELHKDDRVIVKVISKGIITITKESN